MIMGDLTAWTGLDWMVLKQLMIRSNGGFRFDCDEHWISPVICETPQTDENCGQIAEGPVTCQAVCCLIHCHQLDTQ
jgi:hypothetical protein